MIWLKQKWFYVLIILFLLGEFIFSKDWFFIQLLFFSLIVKVIIDVKLPKTLRIYLEIAVWGTFLSELGLAIYGNYLLKGRIVPGWLEFIHSSQGVVLGLALFFIGIILSSRESLD